MDAGIHSSGGGRLEGPSGKRARLPRRRPALCRRSVPRGIPPRASAHHRPRPRWPAARAPLHGQRRRRLLHPQDRVRRGLREVLSRHPRRSGQRAPVHGKRRAALARFEHRAREHELWTRVEGSPHRAARDHRLAWRRAAHRGGAAASSPGKALASLAKKGHGMIPVVLLGGLNIVRALGLAKIPVIVASCEGRKPSMASRYCAATLELPPLEERDALVEALARAGRRLAEEHGVPVPLFYDNGDRLARVQDHRASLERHFALLLNEPSLGQALLDKSLFQALAERCALPVPRRLDWDALDEERAPVLVKPKMRTGWEHSSVNQRLFGGAGKARIFASGREARTDPLVRQLADVLCFQEYVPGGDEAIWSFHGFAAPGGEVLEWFVGRKIRTFPALTGR